MAVFRCDPRNFEVTEEMIESFNTRGYVFVRYVVTTISSSMENTTTSSQNNYE